MRAFLVVGVLALAAVSSADRLILIPTGKKIISNSLRYEILTAAGMDTTLGWVGTGIGQSYDFEIYGESFNSNRITSGIDLSYNYTVPVADFAPGISFGMQDVSNQTRRGRTTYLAVTYRFGNSGEHNQDVPTELTFGFWTRERGLMFLGVKFPFSEVVSFIAEHDSDQLTAGLELSPTEGGTFRVLFREHETLIGIRFQAMF